MRLPSLLDEIKQVPNGSHLIVRECLDREVAADSQDDDRMEVVGQETADSQ